MKNIFDMCRHAVRKLIIWRRVTHQCVMEYLRPLKDNTMSYQETTHLKVPVIMKHSLPNVFDNIDENIFCELI